MSLHTQKRFLHTEDVFLHSQKMYFHSQNVSAHMNYFKGQSRKFSEFFPTWTVILNDRSISIDLRSLQPYVEELEGIPVLQLDVLLCAKFTSHLERSEGEAGDEKRRTDLGDIHWISDEMKKRHLSIRKEVCNMFVCGPYHMLLVLESLYDEFGKEGVGLFESVGGRDLECDWGDVVFAEQAELYGLELDLANFTEEEFKLLGSQRHPNFLP